jgi:SAM-dependent methyltransferase
MVSEEGDMRAPLRSIVCSCLSQSSHRLALHPTHHRLALSRYRCVSLPLRVVVDDTYEGAGSHYTFSSKTIDAYIKGTSKSFGSYRSLISRYEGEQPSYTRDEIIEVVIGSVKKEQWLYFALLKHEAKLPASYNAVVFGSMDPWTEVMALETGAASVFTVEYNNLTYEHPLLTTVSGSDFETFYDTKLEAFDVAFSMSSFDHDGLGRYGDPINPNGDMLAMAKVMKVLKKGGLLFLSVPVGPDVVVFNLHRRYGNIRLPLLLEGWEIVDRVGWNDRKVTQDANWRQTYEPIIVLRRPLD